MVRTSLSDILSLPDPFLPYNFDLVVANVPGGGNSRSLTTKCMSTSIPGVTIEPALVQLHGAEAQFAGRIIWSHNLSVTYLETRDISTRQTLTGWFFYARDIRNNTGSYKAQYATLAQLLLYDDVGNVTRTIQLENCFPLTLEDAAISGNESTPVNLTGTLSYDFFQDV